MRSPKKHAPAKSTIRTAFPELGMEDTISHYNAVLIEDLTSSMKQVVEGMEHTRISLESKIDDFREEVNRRFETLEAAVTGHSGMLAEQGKTLAGHSGKLDKLQNTVDGHTERLENIEKTVQRIETTFGERLDDHGRRITVLETVPQ